MAKVALVTGVSGQDGSYLAELLLGKGYEVHGLIRPGSTNRTNLAAIEKHLHLHEADLPCPAAIEESVERYRPSEIYHLASPSFVPLSWESPLEACEVIGMTTVRLLEAVRRHQPECRFYFAGSSEMFGNVNVSPQSETTPFHPANPYGAAKLYAHHLISNYRERHGVYACTGILFNHESPRRHPAFVTRKITKTAAAIKLGLAEELRLGNLESSRDWGFAGDYVKSMWLMLQQERPMDLVIGTGVSTTVREFCAAAFSVLDLNYENYVTIDPRYYRDKETTDRVADSKRAAQTLGWRPRTSLAELVRMMVQHDLHELSVRPERFTAAA